LSAPAVAAIVFVALGLLGLLWAVLLVDCGCHLCRDRWWRRLRSAQRAKGPTT